MKKIATCGCSHSSDFAGTSWPIFLQEKLGCELLLSHSVGAGNEMNLEKVKYIVDQAPDLLIVQLTDPNRYTLALAHQVDLKTSLCDKISEANSTDPTYLIGTHHYNGQLYYTFNTSANDNNLRVLTGDKNITVDHFFMRQVIVSNHNLCKKVLHTMATMAFIAEKKKVPLVFFSWSVDIHKIIKDAGYSEIFRDMNIIPGFIEQFVFEHNLKPIPVGMPGVGHHGSENQKLICDNYIFPYLNKRGLL